MGFSISSRRPRELAATCQRTTRNLRRGDRKIVFRREVEPHSYESPRELYDRMLDIYPDRLNPGSLWSASKAAKPKSGD
jgi:hypothetical protein